MGIKPVMAVGFYFTLFCTLQFPSISHAATSECADSIVGAVVEHAANRPADTGRRVDRGYVLCKWAHLSLPHLEPHHEPEFLKKLGWQWNSRLELLALSQQFRHRDLRVELTVLQQSSRAEPHAILFGAFYQGRRIVGVAYASYIVLPSGPLMELSSVSFENMGPGYRGVGQSVLEFFFDNVADAMGIKKMSAIGDYMGRYVWARMEGMHLANTDPDGTVWSFTDISGEKVDTWTQTIRNLDRFLELHQIPVAELEIVRGTQTMPLTATTEIQTLQDLASLRHAGGVQVSVQPMLGIDSNDQGFFGKSKSFDVGAAFMAADYSQIDGAAVLTHWGASVSPYAMPPYRFQSK